MDKDPNPMTVGPTKWRADHCTTHHYACDCREWEFATRVAEYERDAERYRWLREYDVDSYLACGRLEKLDAAIDAAINGANAYSTSDVRCCREYAPGSGAFQSGKSVRNHGVGARGGLVASAACRRYQARMGVYRLHPRRRGCNANAAGMRRPGGSA